MTLILPIIALVYVLRWTIPAVYLVLAYLFTGAVSILDYFEQSNTVLGHALYGILQCAVAILGLVLGCALGVLIYSLVS